MRLRWFTNVVALAAACAAGGGLAVATAPPGFGPLCWPPVGIGLAGLLAGGLSLWPGVWAAAFGLAVLTYPEGSHPTLQAAAAATAYAAQAALGAWLVRRTVRYPAPLVRGRDVLVFLAVAGPIHTVLSPAAGLLVPDFGWSAGWAEWWLADAVGGAVFVHVVLTAVGTPAAVWRGRRLTVAVPLVAAVAVAAVGYRVARAADAGRAADRVAAEANRAASVLRGDFERVQNGLYVLRGSFRLDRAALSLTNRGSVLVAMRMLRRTSPLLRIVSISTRVRAADRAAFEAALRAATPTPGPLDGRVFDRTPDGTPVPAGDRPEYLVLSVVESDIGPGPALGFDLLTDPDRRVALERAVDAGVPSSPPPVRLLESPAGRNGVVLYLPFFDGTGPGGKFGRWDRFRGVAAAVFDRTGLRDRLAESAPPGLRFALTDTATEGPPPRGPGDLRASVPLEFGGRTWELHTTAGPVFTADSRGRRAGLVAIGASALLGCLATLLLTLTGRTAAVTEEVSARTAALRASESRLTEAHRVARLGAWELDPVGPTVRLSAEAAALAGFSPEPRELTLEEFAELARPEDADALGRAAKAVAAGVPPADLELQLTGLDDRTRWLAAAFFPGEGPPGGSRAGVLQDVTERKAGELAAREAEQRFRNLADTAPVVIWVTAPDGHCTYLSRRWEELTGRPPESGLGYGWLEAVHPDDRGPAGDAFRAAAVARAGYRIEYRVVRPDGAVRWCIDTGVPRAGPGGEDLGQIGTVFDITDRKAAEERLAEAQRIARLGYWEWHPDAGTHTWSDEEYLIFGVRPDEFRPTLEALQRFVHPDDRERIAAEGGRMLALDSSARFEYRIVRPDGQVRHLVEECRVQRAPDGRPYRITGVTQDVTAAREAERAVREGEARLRLALDAGRMGTWEWDFVAGRLDWDPLARALVGFPPEAADGTVAGFLERVHPDDRPAVGRALAAAPAAGTDLDEELRVADAGGAVRWVAARGRVARYAAGRPARMFGIVYDVTGRKAAELAVRESEELFRRAFESSGCGMALTTIDGRYLRVNPALCRMLGLSEPELLGGSWQAVTDPADLPENLALVRRCLDGEFPAYAMEKRYRHRDGHAVWAHLTVALVREPDGTPRYFISQVQNVTERKRAEVELRASEARLAEAQRIAHLGGWETDPAAGWVWASDELCRILGRPPGMPLPADDVRGFLPLDPRAVADAAPDHPVEVVRPDGQVRFLLVRARVAVGADGQPRVTGTAQDVTERTLAERERQRFEARLRDTQKLESLGVLAGGIAHDFNNLLTGVLGNASLVREALPPDSPLHGYLRPIEKSAEHAAHLCRQMLAYAGKGGAMRGPVDLNRLVRESEDLLGLSVPKTAQVRYDLTDPLPPAAADAGQLRQVLLNLVQNAAEALDPRGGTVTVRTGAGEGPPCEPPGAVWSGEPGPGPHVWLEVADTGAGMAADTVARVFEPFFTTKFTGRGLGLSAVHGIVRSHAGSIGVASEPGRGTRFRVCLPAAAVADVPAPRPATPAGAVAGTALVADDEPVVRGIAAVALRAQGLDVVEACDGREAVDLVRADPGRFAVAVLDVLMPEMDGRDALREIRAVAPGLPVIVVSGYSEEAAVDAAEVGGVEFLQKPFRPADLTAVVRRLLTR